MQSPHLQRRQRLERQQVGCVPQPQAPQLFVGQAAGGEEQEGHLLYAQQLRSSEGSKAQCTRLAQLTATARTG